jgi:hypothetical protein
MQINMEKGENSSFSMEKSKIWLFFQGGIGGSKTEGGQAEDVFGLFNAVIN